MKKTLSLCLLFILLISIFSSIFADEHTSERSTSPNTTKRYELGQVAFLTEESIDKWYPVIPLIEVKDADSSFNKLKKSAYNYKTFLYDDGVPVGEVSNRKSYGEYRHSGTIRYDEPPPGYISAMPFAVEGFANGDVIILDDEFERFIVTPNETVIFVNSPKFENISLSTEPTYTLTDFLSAVVRRNEYINYTRPYYQPVSILDFIVVSPPPINPMPYVFVGTAFLSLSVIAVLYFRRRKRKKNLD